MVRVGICDDEPDVLEHHRKILSTISEQLGVEMQIACCISKNDLLCEMELNGAFDILLLDIEMENENGVDMAQELRELDFGVVFIFVSSHEQYCKRIIDVQPYAFIDKPMQIEPLKTKLDILFKTQITAKRFFEFSYAKVKYRIPLREIRYFESDRRCIRIYTQNHLHKREEYVYYGKLDRVEEFVNSTFQGFLRVRKALLVNVNAIREYHADRIVLDDGTEVIISKNYKEAVQRYYMAHI